MSVNTQTTCLWAHINCKIPKEVWNNIINIQAIRQKIV